MALTSLCCDTVTTPQFVRNCEPKIRKGGIPNVGYINCSIEFTDITDESEWETAIEAGAVGLFPLGIGDKPEPEKQLFNTSSCGKEVLVSEIHTLNFRTFDSDLANNADFDKWDEVGKDWSNYRFFYLDCNGNLYLNKADNEGITPRGFDLSHIIPETNEEAQFFQLVLKFDKIGLVKPFKNNAINALLASIQGSN
jgi:hypothetical protein